MLGIKPGLEVRYPDFQFNGIPTLPSLYSLLNRYLLSIYQVAGTLLGPEAAMLSQSLNLYCDQGGRCEQICITQIRKPAAVIKAVKD